MGGQLSTAEVERRRAVAAQERQAENKRAVRLATGIVEHLNRIVIRPGPKPEERQCTEVAGELRAEIPALVEIILRDGENNE
jgi:hypothetical protein